MSYEDKTDKELVEGTGYVRCIPSDHDSAAIEMMRRLKNSIEKLNDTTQKYSRILIGLTFILGVLAAIQIYLFLNANQLPQQQKLCLTTETREREGK